MCRKDTTLSGNFSRSGLRSLTSGLPARVTSNWKSACSPSTVIQQATDVSCMLTQRGSTSWIIGFRRNSVISRNRVPSPPQRTKTGTAAGSAIEVPSCAGKRDSRPGARESVCRILEAVKCRPHTRTSRPRQKTARRRAQRQRAPLLGRRDSLASSPGEGSACARQTTVPSRHVRELHVSRLDRVRRRMVESYAAASTGLRASAARSPVPATRWRSRGM